jgi:hypothetical protein
MYDLEAHSLKDLAEESDEDTSGSNYKRTSFDHANGHANGEGSSINRPGKAQRPEKSSVKAGGKAFDR